MAGTLMTKILAMRPSYKPAGDLETIIAMAIHIVDENRDSWSQSWNELDEPIRERRREEARGVIAALTHEGYEIRKN